MSHILRELGPVQLYWEGADRSETSLQEVKPENHNLAGNWQVNVHVKIHKRRALRTLMILSDIFFEPSSTYCYEVDPLENKKLVPKDVIDDQRQWAGCVVIVQLYHERVC
jgi:hypothetical protein